MKYLLAALALLALLSLCSTGSTSVESGTNNFDKAFDIDSRMDKYEY